MNVPAIWRQVVRRSNPGIIPLVTIFPASLACSEHCHPAEQAGAIRLSVEHADVESMVGRLPFWPLLLDWPPMKERIFPRERRAEIPSTQFRILTESGFPTEGTVPDQPTSFMCRIDLWAPGLTLSQVIHRLMGQITAAPVEGTERAISITVQDGPPFGDREIGESFIQADDFPDAPDEVLGRARRYFVIGPFPDPLPTIPIDRDGRRFYFMDAETFEPPDQFYVGGVLEEENIPTVVFRPFPTDPTQRYTEVVFPRPISDSLRLGGVLVAGGVGISDDPFMAIAEDIGGFDLTPQAKALFAEASSRFSAQVFLNATASAFDLLRSRLLPQTDLIATWRAGKLHAYRLRGETDGGSALLGAGLLYRVNQPQSQSVQGNIFNVIEVQYRRNILADLGEVPFRSVLTVDQSYGGEIGTLLAESQRRYGRRLLQIPALDLVGGADAVPMGVMELAELEARLHALEARQHTYDVTWEWWLGIGINSRRTLTDPDEGLNGVQVRVVGEELLPTGPRITFETEP